MPSTLGRLLARRGWTDVELARRTGIDRAHLNALTNGRVEPTVGTALAIARALAMPVAAVFPATERRRAHMKSPPMST
jgi:transcriptional regulator with XRE-family HTH domain